METEIMTAETKHTKEQNLHSLNLETVNKLTENVGETSLTGLSSNCTDIRATTAYNVHLNERTDLTLFGAWTVKKGSWCDFKPLSIG